MRSRRAVCGWCGKNTCITSNDDLFYIHYYFSQAAKTKTRCPYSGKDSNVHTRTPHAKAA